VPANLANPGFRHKPANAGNPVLPPLILMTDETRGPDPLAAANTLPRGNAVILRHYDDPGRIGLAWRLAAICRRRGLVFLVAADWRLAWAVGADGVHLPEGLARRGPRAWGAPAMRSTGFLVTAAAHSGSAIVRAARAGADAVLLSPVFPTASHPGAVTLGPLRFARYCKDAAVPVYALGGINPQTAARLAGTGLAGIAGVCDIAGDGGRTGLEARQQA
jgi:thiamine-phosphate pyrophosphorylase